MGERPNSYLPLTIDSGVRTAQRRTPGKIALAEGSRKLSYSQLVDRFNQVSTGAAEGLGLRRGDHAALYAPNCLEFIDNNATITATDTKFSMHCCWHYLTKNLPI